MKKPGVIRVGPRRPGRLSLRGLREAAGKTQAQVAKASGLTQPEVSKLETAESLDDRQVLTVRRYLRALGDDLELVATSKFGHRIGIAPPAKTLSMAEVESLERAYAIEALADRKYDGAMVKFARKALGMTRERLSWLLGVTISDVASWETGKVEIDDGSREAMIDTLMRQAEP